MGSDRGLYSCQVDYQGYVQQVQHRLLVLESPSLVTQPANTSLAVSLGQTVVLRCAASGQPNPLISWRGGPGLGELGQGLSLSVRVSRETEGEYRCLADNGVGQPAEKTFSITALCKFSIPQCLLYRTNQSINYRRADCSPLPDHLPLPLSLLPPHRHPHLPGGLQPPRQDRLEEGRGGGELSPGSQQVRPGATRHLTGPGRQLRQLLLYSLLLLQHDYQ